MNMTAPALIRGPEEGKRLTAAGNELVFKVVSADSNRHLVIIDFTTPSGFPDPAPHFHAHTDEAFYVLEGELTFRVPEGEVRAGPGSTICVPLTVPHAYANRGVLPARYLLIMTPAGFEGYFEEMAALLATGGVPDPAILATLNRRYDQVLTTLQ